MIIVPNQNAVERNAEFRDLSLELVASCSHYELAVLNTVAVGRIYGSTNTVGLLQALAREMPPYFKIRIQSVAE